jgi:hypothetical protein
MQAPAAGLFFSVSLAHSVTLLSVPDFSLATDTGMLNSTVGIDSTGPARLYKD